MSSQIKVYFLKKWRDIRPGETLSCSKKVSNVLIENKVCRVAGLKEHNPFIQFVKAKEEKW